MSPSHTEPDDETLVLRALLGDLPAYDELVRRYRGAALAVAEQVCRCPQAAEDATQEAFLLAFKALPQLQDPARFGSWIRSIVRHRALRAGKRDRRSVSAEDEELDRLLRERCGAIVPDPLEATIREIERISVRRALGRLPEEHQIVLRLYYYEEWTVKRIAEFLSLPLPTVKWRLHQGRQWLKNRLEGC
jgi:RNA polymerase sigma-70 factor (ECF subfamily)